MSLLQLLLILKARARVIFMVLALTLLAACATVVLMPKTYKATTSIVLNYKGTDSVSGSTAPGQLVSGYLPTYMSTQIDIIKSMTVALRVVDRLKLASVPLFREEYEEATKGNTDIREWLANYLLKKLEVKPSKESSVLNVSFKASDPKYAAAIADGFVDAYQQVTAEIDANPARSASNYFTEQLKNLRNNFEAAQEKVTRYQRESGIVNADNRIDVENTRLNELSNQLVVAQSQLMEANSRGKQVQGRADESPDVANNALIQGLKIELNKAETKLAIISEKYTRDHPTYQEAKAEVTKLQAALRANIAIISRSISNNAQILERRANELRAAVEEQKARIQDLNQKRNELNLLVKDAETAQKTYEAVSQRLAQSKIQGQSNQSDISVLTSAIIPRDAASPRPTIVLLVAAFVGMFLGICCAIVMELLDRRVRSVRDLEELVGLPVLVRIDSFGLEGDGRQPGLLPWNRPKMLPGSS
ncbi:chain length determinant protein EpsF [Noviherbaspirillum humi]|uniref:Chain length determinant protein EpsF n=1 Tax=Noviherbaspirillum humi TaxID=1688639 RepID=A0A239GW50_9BURK|nr:chain length determinant protein EpsF [Noviherbaspirillum humi]SNS73102.1 chain length determinant protein EpsF [Noviherbaspirillum humi]